MPPLRLPGKYFRASTPLHLIGLKLEMDVWFENYKGVTELDGAHFMNNEISVIIGKTVVCFFPFFQFALNLTISQDHLYKVLCNFIHFGQIDCSDIADSICINSS